VTVNESSDDIKYGGAMLIILMGLVTIAFLAYCLPTKDGAWKPSDVMTLIGSITTFLGTVVGAFLGVQVGSAGKQKAEAITQRALAALAPEAASRVLRGE
jgi:surface antigen